MAVLVYLRKTRETETEVEYQFGDGPELLTRSLVIDKLLNSVRATDGQDEQPALMAGSWMVHQSRRQGRWPDSGVLAS